MGSFPIGSNTGGFLIPNAPVVDLVTDQIRAAMYSGVLRPLNLSKQFYRFEFCKMTASSHITRSKSGGSFARLP
jgi:hypothetical protein